MVPATHLVEVGRVAAVFKGAGLLYTPATALPWHVLVLKALQEELCAA